MLLCISAKLFSVTECSTQNPSMLLSTPPRTLHCYSVPHPKPFSATQCLIQNPSVLLSVPPRTLQCYSVPHPKPFSATQCPTQNPSVLLSVLPRTLQCYLVPHPESFSATQCLIQNTSVILSAAPRTLQCYSVPTQNPSVLLSTSRAVESLAPICVDRSPAGWVPRVRAGCMGDTASHRQLHPSLCKAGEAEF
jgi:hypothetical protein